jgi:hypothetical protein
MPFRLSAAAIEKQVGTRSDRVSDDVLLEAVTAILSRPKKIDRTHDIPYLAGYSSDGRTVFIDRHLPVTMRVGHTFQRIVRFLVVHEMVEKSLLDEMRLHYLHAHQIALRAEQAAVRAAGISWSEYDRFMKANEKKIGDERLRRVPPTLDLTPYRDEHDFDELLQLTRTQK